MRKFFIILIVLCLSGFAAMKMFWPEEYVINAPFLQFVTGWGGGGVKEAELQERIKVPEGFKVSIYADGLDHARGLQLTANGDLLVSTPRSGKIKLLKRDDNGDGKADGIQVLVSGLHRPHGMDIRDGFLYIAETNALARIPFDEAGRRADRSRLDRIVTGLPGGGNHWTRTVRFGPDGMLYLSVGSSCNVCLESDKRRATILRFQPDGSGEEIYASGLRNTVGFAWHPVTGDLYGVDNGRDLLGDDFPPCEMNLIVEGGFYGWPFLNGGNIPDPDFGNREVVGAIPPVLEFGAHTAPLGLCFLSSPNTPDEYKNAALVALHGSWNRTNKSGYEVLSLHWKPDGSIEKRPFITGFKVDETVYGRPVDIVQAPDGTIYLSDDYGELVYKITYSN